jgi:hypothetical protein
MKCDAEKRNYRKQSGLRFAKPEKPVPVESERVGVRAERVGVRPEPVPVRSQQVPIGTEVARQEDLDLRAMVFHVRPHEELEVRRALKRFGGPRRRRGAALAAAIRALKIQMRKRK